MNLVPRDPFDAFMPLREAMNRLFEDSIVGPRLEFFTGRSFPVDIYQTDDQKRYVIEAALPGFKPEEVQITAMNDTLMISVAKKGVEKVEKGTYVRRERYEGEMSRTITLPTTIDPAKVEATYEHGVLTVYIPKTEEAKPQQIPIQPKKEPAGAH